MHYIDTMIDGFLYKSELIQSCNNLVPRYSTILKPGGEYKHFMLNPYSIHPALYIRITPEISIYHFQEFIPLHTKTLIENIIFSPGPILKLGRKNLIKLPEVKPEKKYLVDKHGVHVQAEFALVPHLCIIAVRSLLENGDIKFIFYS